MTPQIRELSHRVLFKLVENCETDGCHADIYLPEQPDNAPIAIMIHGGAWVTGASSDIPPQQVDYLLSHGIAVISLEYRMAPHVKMPEIRGDLLEGYIWIQEKLNAELGLKLDTRRTVLMGWSAGATATLFMDRDIEAHGSQLSRPLGLVPTYPLADLNAGFAKPESAFLEYMKDKPEQLALANKIYDQKVCVSMAHATGDPGPPPNYPGLTRPRDVWCMFMLMSGALNSVLNGHPPPFIGDECPILSVKPSHSPTFIVCAAADELIDPNQSRDYHAKLKETGVECEIREAEGMWHGITEKSVHDWPEGNKWWEQAILPSLEWVVRKLKA